jgi:hypothetical protein
VRPHEAPAPTDTDPKVEALLIARYRAMSPLEKLEIVRRLNRSLIILSEAGVRRRHPGIGERDVKLRAAALRLPRETMIRAFGWDPNEG